MFDGKIELLVNAIEWVAATVGGLKVGMLAMEATQAMTHCGSSHDRSHGSISY